MVSKVTVKNIDRYTNDRLQWGQSQAAIANERCWTLFVRAGDIPIGA